VLCKIVGVYQIGIQDKVLGKRSMEQVAVMQNIFYNRKITRIFDLKGSLRGRFAAHMRTSKDDATTETPSHASEASSGQRGKNFSGSDRSGRGVDRSPANDGKEKDASKVPGSGPATLLDGDFLEFTLGRPMPMTDSAKAVFQMSILNVSHFGSNFILCDDASLYLTLCIATRNTGYSILIHHQRSGLFNSGGSG
jgi:hypothetical protein